MEGHPAVVPVTEAVSSGRDSVPSGPSVASAAPVPHAAAGPVSMEQHAEGSAEKELITNIIARRMCSPREVLNSWQLLINLKCFNLAQDKNDMSVLLDAQNNTALVAALMYGVALGGFFTEPTPAPNSTFNHLGFFLGSKEVNGSLWCVSVVALLTATLVSVFYINMLKQVDGQMYSLFEEVMGRKALQVPLVLCSFGVVTQVVAFLSFLTIAWGEDRTACCVLLCASMIMSSLFYAETRLVFATDVTIQTQHALQDRSKVILSATEIVESLNSYISEKKVLGAMSWEEFESYMAPDKMQLDFADIQIEHVKTRANCLPRHKIPNLAYEPAHRHE